MAGKILMGEKVQLWVKDKSGATPTCLAMATSLSVEISADATSNKPIKGTPITITSSNFSLAFI